MDETEASEHDMYIAQLKEVFDSCDQTGTGRLNREELFLLCDKLQLEDQSEYLVNGLLKDQEEVDFGDFKDSFVRILCQTNMDEPLSEEEEDSDEEESGAESDNEDEGEAGETEGGKNEESTDAVKREVSPKFVKGSKRYGRKSLPFMSDEFDCLADDEEDIDVASSTRSLKHSLTADSVTDTDEDGSDSHKKRRRKSSQSSQADEAETFEAEGQLNLMMADSENPTEEEKYLRGIWDSLGVGKNGYISIKELKQVCRHIGMEEMTSAELQQLFEKLDADGDGRVSFQEFLAELFQHNTPGPIPAPGTPRSIGTTPTRSLSAQKKFKYPATAGAEDRTTPSVVQGSGVTGLFSILDPEKTGFAKPDAIIDLWEKYNVPNGADILLALGFELNTKVNLSELSVLLEQELLGADEQNVILQAATASYQQEMRNVKSSLEQSGWAIEKLKLDLSEANTRNSMLAKEVDERHATMEKSSESKLISVEKKYQDQIKSLQMELDKERENYSSITAKDKQSRDSEMEELRQEEGKLRDQLLQAQKEMDRMTGELEETSEHLDESEKLNQRLQRELESVDELHQKLADYENKGIMSPDEQKFTRDKMLRIELENKDLKDQNDELTAELEQIRVQGVPLRKPLESSSPERGSHPPVREGSIMSNYIRPTIVKRALGSPYDYSDDESRSPRDSHMILGEQDDEISVGSTIDKDTIERLKREIQELKNNFDRERKEIEQSCKLEIADIEAKHDEDKGEIMKNIEREKTKILEDFERLQQEALAELGKELQNKFVHEKEDLVQKYESELNLRDQKYIEEKKVLTQRLSSEYEEDIEAQLFELKNKYDQEKFQLEEALTELEPYVRDLETKNTDLQTKLERQKDEMEKKLKQQKTEMEDLFSRHMQSVEDVEKKKIDMELKYKKQISDLELTFRQERLELESDFEKQVQDVRELQKQKVSLELELKQQRDELELSFRQEKQEIQQLYEERIREETEAQKHLDTEQLQGGVAGLTGKTREDFYKLLEEMKTKEREEIRETLANDFNGKEKALQAEFDAKRSELSHIFERERDELREKYEEQIEVLKQQLTQLQEKLEEEREMLAQRFEGEKEAIEEQLAQQIREELEEEICQQMEDIKEAFDDEKREYEAQTNLLKQEVEELQRALDSEDKNRKKLDEVMRANNKLQQEKRMAEKGQIEMKEALESTKKALELRIDELLSEKEGAITAVKAELVESSKQSSTEKAVYDAVVLEKTALESRVSSLTQEVVDLQMKADRANQLQEIVERLTEEQQGLIEKMSQLEGDLNQSQSSVTSQSQQVIEDLTRERTEMQERLKDSEQKLNEVEETAQKFLHLQLDFEQLAFDHSALEETLLETQEKLVDTQQTLDQSEKELKDALRYREYRDKYRHVQKKYDEACKERDKALSFAKSVKEQLTQAHTSSMEEHEDKGRLATVLEEKKHLEIQLQKVNDKLLESTTNFAVSQSQHVKELQQWKDQTTSMVDLQKYTKLQIDLVDSQRSLRDLQESISNREEVVSKKLKESAEYHNQEVKELGEVKESLGMQLKTLQEILDNQIEKYKEQFEVGERRNALVVDLYKENADLMQALYHAEEQKKDAISKCYKLEDQCNNLRRMVKKIARVAIS